VNGLTIRWADLDCCDRSSLRALLSADELERASRLRFERDRRRFVAARGLLRTLLGERLGVDAWGLEFDYGERGKPRLRGQTGLRFNLAHSGPLLLVALSEGRDVGVDVEAIRDDLAAESIARRFLPAEAADEIEGHGGHARIEAFFSAWVRQEAFAKASGAGLELIGQAPDPERWRVVDLELAPGYAAALAIESDALVDRDEQLIADLARIVDPGAEVGEAVELLPSRAAEPAH
jgi:4'-phosphopantetheinyl transferase